ncbi:MAG: SDR family NAD(P)-dependent oxidoreductase [Cyanobacteria bacterium RM1_2_2]|nr:SDR family NAD(P)-dependent oxidoreductase [Cyanobacteria bacterium RM1_2_2]
MNTNGLEIAIIGMAGRFPGASTLAEFWQNLQQGVESIQVFSEDELQAQGVDPALLQSPQYVKAGAALAGIDQFDAEFFGFSPKEAEILDPQQRLFLECAWEALENAGYDAEQYDGAIGVYAGAAINSYLLNLYRHPTIAADVGRYQLFLASDKDFLTTRVSYKLNLTGPSVDVQTACSTSLVAVHIACQSLLSGECDMALAGGVALSQQAGYLYQEGGIYSPDGHCRAFDANARGTVAGSGLGIVVLKLLEDALQDGDCIQAVIKGSAVNNDGAQKVSYTAPSIPAQANVIRAAHLVADISSDTISYVETHGTGTALGDPIEIAALTEAFQTSAAPAPQTCAIGSLKPNIGHLDTAAGIASLIKTALALKHRQIPPSLHFQQPNPQINFAQSPFYVNTQLSDWHSPDANLPLRAGVSSFGIGGTNAHVVLESAPEPSPSSPSRPWQILTLSAKTASALDSATDRLLSHLRQHPNLNLADVAYTLQRGRRAFPHRRTVLCQTVADTIQALESNDPHRLFTQAASPSQRAITFLFPGQGSQYPTMGRDLYQHEPHFRATIDHCCALLQPHLDLDLRTLLYPSTSPLTPPPLTQTRYAQPALFVVEYALAQLWLSWGIQPSAMIGHSIGEYVAATLVGVFELEDALRLVALRGQLMQDCPAGAMLSVALSEAEIESKLMVNSANLSIAAVNAPCSCVVSGTLDAIDALEQQLTAESIACRRLQTSHAFHSPLMASAMAPLREQFQSVQLHPPQLPFISNLTGTWITAAEATNPDYWIQHLRYPVRFASGVSELLQKPNLILLEVGAGRTLSTLAKQTARTSSSTQILTSLRHPQQQEADIAILFTSLGQLWLSGVEINRSRLYPRQQQRIPLPTYPFERQRYWIELQPVLEPAPAPSKNPDLSEWFYLPSWKRSTRLIPILQPAFTESETWLIFLDQNGIGATLAQQLSQAGQSVITVSIGDAFAHHESDTAAYVMNPQSEQDYRSLFTSLKQSGNLPQQIVHCWSLTSSDSGLEDAGFYSLIAIAQALHGSKAQITLLTNHLFDLNGSELIEPMKATLLGASKVIWQECGLPCQIVEIDTSQTNAVHLLAELAQPDRESSCGWAVAHRNYYRWMQTIEPIKRSEEQANETLLRTNSVYLIAGDLVEGLGLIFAQCLAEVQATLILVGRAGLPEKHQWENWMATHGTQDSVSRYILTLQNLEAQGTKLYCFSADLTDECKLQSIVEQVCQQFGTIHGAIHADVMGDQASCLIHALNQAEIDRQFRAKVTGLRIFESVLRGKVSGFYLLQSSLSTLVGGVGFAAYAAANAFMDAFTIQQNQLSSVPWISINWDACRFDQPTSTDPTGSTLIDLAITPAEVKRVFRHVLAHPELAQVAVSPTDLFDRIQTSFQTVQSPVDLSVRSSVQTGGKQHSRPQLSTDYVAPRSDVEQTVAEAMQTLLGIEAIGIHDNFFELGGDSLLAIQAISRLRETFQVELPMREFLFESPTVAGIAKMISENRAKVDAQIETDFQAMESLLTQIEQMENDNVNTELKKSH